MTEVAEDIGSEESEIDIDSAVDSLSAELFPQKDEPKDEFVEEIDEVEDESPEEKVEEKPEEKAEEKPEEKPKREPPVSWKKDMHEAWDAMPDNAKDYVEKREAQMREGLEKDRGDANLGRTMRDIMTPYSQVIQQQGIDEPTAVKALLDAHYKLSTGTPEQKKQYFDHLMKSYGISGEGQESPVDPKIQNIEQRQAYIESQLRASHERALQAQREQIEKTVKDFSESHPHFEDLSDDIAKFVSAGFSLDEAYEKALWGSPSLRQAEIDRIAKEKADDEAKRQKEEADKAKKAKSVNVNSRDTSKAPTAPTGTWEDTMRDTYRKINSRN